MEYQTGDFSIFFNVEAAMLSVRLESSTRQIDLVGITSARGITYNSSLPEWFECQGILPVMLT